MNRYATWVAETTIQEKYLPDSSAISSRCHSGLNFFDFNKRIQELKRETSVGKFGNGEMKRETSIGNFDIRDFTRETSIGNFDIRDFTRETSIGNFDIWDFTNETSIGNFDIWDFTHEIRIGKKTNTGMKHLLIEK